MRRWGAQGRKSISGSVEAWTKRGRSVDETWTRRGRNAGTTWIWAPRGRIKGLRDETRDHTRHGPEAQRIFNFHIELKLVSEGRIKKDIYPVVFCPVLSYQVRRFPIQGP